MIWIILQPLCCHVAFIAHLSRRSCRRRRRPAAAAADSSSSSSSSRTTASTALTVPARVGRRNPAGPSSSSRSCRELFGARFRAQVLQHVHVSRVFLGSPAVFCILRTRHHQLLRNRARPLRPHDGNDILACRAGAGRRGLGCGQENARARFSLNLFQDKSSTADHKAVQLGCNLHLHLARKLLRLPAFAHVVQQPQVRRVSRAAGVAVAIRHPCQDEFLRSVAGVLRANADNHVLRARPDACWGVFSVWEEDHAIRLVLNLLHRRAARANQVPVKLFRRLYFDNHLGCVDVGVGERRWRLWRGACGACCTPGRAGRLRW